LRKALYRRKKGEIKSVCCSAKGRGKRELDSKKESTLSSKMCLRKGIIGERKTTVPLNKEVRKVRPEQRRKKWLFQGKRRSRGGGNPFIAGLAVNVIRKKRGHARGNLAEEGTKC